MSRRIPNGAYCLFQANPGGTRNGRVVLVHHRDIQDPDHGGALTVKVYRSEKVDDPETGWRHGRITLACDTLEAGPVPPPLPHGVAPTGCRWCPPSRSARRRGSAPGGPRCGRRPGPAGPRQWDPVAAGPGALARRPRPEGLVESPFQGGLQEELSDGASPLEGEPAEPTQLRQLCLCAIIATPCTGFIIPVPETRPPAWARNRHLL